MSSFSSSVFLAFVSRSCGFRLGYSMLFRNPVSQPNPPIQESLFVGPILVLKSIIVISSQHFSFVYFVNINCFIVLNILLLSFSEKKSYPQLYFPKSPFSRRIRVRYVMKLNWNFYRTWIDAVSKQYTLIGKKMSDGYVCTDMKYLFCFLIMNIYANTL